AAWLRPAASHGPLFVNCEVRYGLKPVLPRVTSTLDWAGALMYDKKSYAASCCAVGECALTAPDQPPKAANGAWFTPLTASGQVVASHGTSLPVERSRTCFQPGEMTAPVLSWAYVPGARVPTSPQSRVRAQRPVVNSPRDPPTSMFSPSGGPSVPAL